MTRNNNNQKPQEQQILAEHPSDGTFASSLASARGAKSQTVLLKKLKQPVPASFQWGLK